MAVGTSSPCPLLVQLGDAFACANYVASASGVTAYMFWSNTIGILTSVQPFDLSFFLGRAGSIYMPAHSILYVLTFPSSLDEPD